MSDTENGNLSAEVKAHHKARTEVPSRPGVDARLDSRSADEMEPVNIDHDPHAAKPQHVDGPDVAGQIEHTAKVLKAKSKPARKSEPAAADTGQSPTSGQQAPKTTQQKTS